MTSHARSCPLLIDWAKGEDVVATSPIVVDGLLSTAMWYPCKEGCVASRNESPSPIVCFSDKTPRTVMWVEVFWGTGANSSGPLRSDPPELIVQCNIEPGTGPALLRRESAILSAVPQAKMRPFLPPVTQMSESRHAFETSGTYSVYKLPEYIGRSVISLSFVLSQKRRQLCVRLLRAWGPFDSDPQSALQLLQPPRQGFMGYDSRHPHEHIGQDHIRMHRHKGEQFPRYLLGNGCFQHDFSCGALALSTDIYDIGKVEFKGQEKFLSQHHSIWRVILSYLTWMELKGTMASVSKEMVSMANTVWEQDSIPEKQWLEFGSYRPASRLNLQHPSVRSDGTARHADSVSTSGADIEINEPCARLRNIPSRITLYARSFLYQESQNPEEEMENNVPSATYRSLGSSCGSIYVREPQRTSYYSQWPDPANSSCIESNQRHRISSGRCKQQRTRKRLRFQGKRVHALVAASSRWSPSAEEDPQNLVDGNPKSWYSSADVHGTVQIIVDLARAVPIRKVVLYWGDDNCRIRPCSKRFAVQVRSRPLAPRAREKMQNGTLFHDMVVGSKSVIEREEGWKTVFEQNKILELVRQPFGQPSEGDSQEGPGETLTWQETPGVTTTTIDVHETAIAACRILLYEKQLYWNNHALHGVEMWGQARRGDV